jgi:hypothetical protein
MLKIVFLIIRLGIYIFYLDRQISKLYGWEYRFDLLTRDYSSYSGLVDAGILLTATVFEWGLFFDGHAKEFLKTTQFLENIKEKSKKQMFFLVVGTFTFIAIWATTCSESWIMVIPGTIVLAFIFYKVISSFNFKLFEWYSTVVEKYYYYTLLILGSFSFMHLACRSIVISFVQSVPLSVAILVFWLIFIWGIYTFIDQHAVKYQIAFSEFIYSLSKEQRFFCAHCHGELNETVIRGLSSQDSVFCVYCGKKVMKHEIYQPSEDEVLKAHQKALEKISNHTKHISGV